MAAGDSRLFQFFAPRGPGVAVSEGILVVVAYWFGAQLIPLLALGAGIRSWLKLRSFGAMSLIVYSALLIIALSVRLFW
jgi:hypothetical protein